MPRAQKNQTNQSTTNSKPAKVIGPYATAHSNTIEVAVWENAVEVEGAKRSVHSITLKRSYRKDDEWFRTTAIRVQDVPMAIHALQQAFDWICGRSSNEGARP